MTRDHRLAWFSLALALVSAAATGCARKVDAGPRAVASEAKAIRDKLAAGGEAKGPAAAAAAEPTGWASLHGAFTFTGAAPTPARISANKDESVCGKHPLYDESLVVGSNGALQNVIVFLRTKVKPHDDYEQTKAKPVLLDNRDCRFEPHVLAMRTTQPLQLKNSDPVGHNSNISTVANAAVNVLLPSNIDTEQNLSKSESLPVKVGCNIHPWMGAWLLVRDDPYAVVSDKEGKFALKNLPAGIPLEFQLWQEKSAGLKNVEISGGEKIKVDSKGRFKVTLKPDEDLAIEIKVPAEALK